MLKLLWLGCALVGAAAATAQTPAADDAAALDLQVAEEKPAAAPARSGAGLRLFVEGAAGRMSQRYGLGSENVRRASLDVSWSGAIAPQWRAVLSNRLDDLHPVEAGQRSTLNSLREAYVGWQDAASRWAVDLGRINLRNGPAYGFNPTDYFRDGALRAVTSSDPLAQRENRLGTVMLRGQTFWSGGAASLVWAPKLHDRRSDASFGLDLGATNHSDRWLVTLSSRPTERVTLQGLAFHEKGKGVQLGVNSTALLSDAVVAFAEWSGGRDFELASVAPEGRPHVKTAHRAVAGLTYTTASKLSLTAEYEYNGFALDRAQWDGALARHGLEAMGGYLTEVQRRQDIASRRAVLLYASQRDGFVRNLELTGLVRWNLEDRSRFVWAEARYHWPQLDVALQWQASLGGALSEFGAQTNRQLLQVLAAYYF